MKHINTILIVIIIILLLITIFLKKEKFTLNDNLSDVEKQIKLLEFAMTSMKDNHNTEVHVNTEKKPYKTVYNYF